MRVPSERNRDNSGPVLGNLQVSRLRQIEMLAGRVAPPAVVVRQRRVRRAEVGGSYSYGARQAPFGVAGASKLVAGPTGQAVVEKGGT